jgi:hypothetical protein
MVVAAEETNGFLVFELDRYAYAWSHHGGSDIKRKFEVPLTEEFLANFTISSEGTLACTGFCCDLRRGDVIIAPIR